MRPGKKIRSLGGVAQRKRRHSSFQLDALVVVEINEIINEFSGLLKILDLLAVNTLGLENGEEVFHHGVVIAVSPS